jgi:Flp pilus assembly protein TadG
VTSKDERGQAAVELALALPLFFLLLLGAVQVALVVRDQVLLTHAAREAAREAAVNPSPEAARRAALAGAPLAAERLTVRAMATGRGGRVTVAVRYRSPTSVPLVGPLVPDALLQSRASMRIEA